MFDRHELLLGTEGLTKDVNELHYGKSRIHYFLEFDPFSRLHMPLTNHPTL